MHEADDDARTVLLEGEELLAVARKKKGVANGKEVCYDMRSWLTFSSHHY